MPIVASKAHRWRTFAAHGFLVVFLLFTLFPLAMVVSISLRRGNFAAGSLIPEDLSFEHWKLALGMSYVDVLRRKDNVGGSGLVNPLPAALPQAGSLTATLAAELLTLAPDPIVPGEMP